MIGWGTLCSHLDASGRAGSPSPPLIRSTSVSHSANGRLGEPSLPGWSARVPISKQPRDGLTAVGDRHGAATGHEVLRSVDLHRREDRGVEIGHADGVLDDGLG